MMKHVKKQNKSKKETLKSSLTFKWVSLVAATITVSFVIFSIAIYSLVKQQIISQERNLTESVATTFQRRLVEIPTSLQISNVVPQLSPNTNRILEGQTPITSNDGGNVFNDDVLATLSNRDTSITIYNPAGDVVFSNGNVPDEGMPQFSKTENHVLKVVTSHGKIHMKVYQKIFSERTHRLTGYLIVDNSMDQQNQVFKSIPYTSLDIYNDNIRKYNKLKLKIDSNFDMNFLIESMPKQIDKKIFTKDLQELIISLAYLYDIDAQKMQAIIKTCITPSGTVSRDELRKVARNHYQFDHSGLLPTIVEFTQPEFLRKPIGDNSKMAKMIYTFETTSPYDFLRSKHKSAEPTKRDIQLLEDLLIDYKLQPGVINVLIDYVLKTNDNKLTRSLVETIAGQWMRKNIETVEDAMEIARKNHSKSKQIKTIKTTKSYQKEATVPVWFNQNIESASATDEERKALEEMLKEYR